MKLLGIDFGLQNTGLAYADSPLAEPLQTIPTATALDKIPELVEKYQVEAIVIGLSEGQMGEKTQQFISSLNEVVSIPIYSHDETLTSFETRQKIAQAGKKRSAREEKIDHLVAAAILQDYLDTNV